MEGVIGHLKEVQKIDSQIDEVLLQKKIYPKKINELKLSLKERTDEIDELNASLADNDKERKRLQDMINIENDRMERVEGKLPQIKTNKEFQALTKEMDNMKKEISKCEESILTLLEEEEALKAEIKEKSEAFDSEAGGINDRISDYEKNVGDFDKRIKKFERAKKSHTKVLKQNHLSTYERIKSRREGVGIVAAIDGVCQGCYMNIPPQLFILVQKNLEIHTCPNCNRILYWEEGV